MALAHPTEPRLQKPRARNISPMSDDASWVTTTHVWSHEVNREHLAAIRRELLKTEEAGGLRHLILEVLAYAQDESESLRRHGAVTVSRRTDGSVRIDDDGRGTDTRQDDQGRVIRKPVMATQDVRFTNSRTSPTLPDGLPRRGISTVAALSSVLIHENHRSDGSWSQTYRYGIPDNRLTPITPRGHSGTVVTFHAEVNGPRELTDDDLIAFPDIDIRLI